MARYLWLTQLYPSGLSGTSVKTKHTLEVLLQAGHSVDVVCLHHRSLLRPKLSWPGKPGQIKLWVIEKDVFSAWRLDYVLTHFGLLMSRWPFRIAKMFSNEMVKQLEILISNHNYATIFIDGYAMLQYLPFLQPTNFRSQNYQMPPLIYIDDEDIAELMRQRWSTTENWLMKIFFWWEWQKCLSYERLYLPRIQQLWAISQQTLRRLKTLTSAKAVLMPTVVPIFPQVFKDTAQDLVFAGLLSWLENIQGLKWFLNQVWPLVRRAHPQTKLRVLGQMAQPNLVTQLQQTPGVLYRGFVPDLATEFNQTAVAIAPILINCGIKIKVVTYLSYGLPVVTTPQSTWGLGGMGGVLTGKTPEEFAGAINQLLANRQLRLKTSRAALKNIHQHHSAKVLIKFFQVQKLSGFIRPTFATQPTQRSRSWS